MKATTRWTWSNLTAPLLLKQRTVGKVADVFRESRSWLCNIYTGVRHRCLLQWRVRMQSREMQLFFFPHCVCKNPTWKINKTHTVGKLGKWIFMPWITLTSTVSLKMPFHCLQLCIQFPLYANCICLIAFSVCEWFVWRKALAWGIRHHLILWQ